MSSGVLTRTGRPAPPRSRAGTRGTPVIDPRIDQRRRDVERGRTRRRWHRVAGLGIVAVLAVGAVALTRTAALDVDRVTVRGATGDRADQVQAAADVRPGDPLVSIDTGAVAGRVEALPWVAGAEVDRSWKGTIAVQVSERSPLAVAGRGEAAVLLDAHGRSLGPAGDADLPRVATAAPEPGAFVAASARPTLLVLRGLPEDLRRQVATLNSGSGGVDAVLHDGIRVRLGDATRLSVKAQALAALLELPDRSSVTTIDLRAPSTPAVTRQGSLTDAEPGGA